MKKIVLLFLFISVSLVAQEKGQEVQIVNYDELKEILYQNDDKLYVVNFWATWCKPCIDELPDFIEVDKEFKSQEDYQMILVSLDFAKHKDRKVKPFLKKYEIENDVYILDDNKRMNQWIPAFDRRWSGSIPATIFIKNGKSKKFVEGTLEKEELEQLIKQHI